MTTVELLPRNLADIRVTVGDDGVWLHFKTLAGQSVTVPMRTVRFALGTPTMRETLSTWEVERIEQARQMEALKL